MALIKLTGNLWSLESVEVEAGDIVKAKLDTENYTEEDGVYMCDGYRIFTKPNPNDKYETDWAGEIVETSKVQMTVTTAQFEKALQEYMDKQFNCQEECCRITAADNERCNPQPEPVKSAMTITTEARDVAVKAVGRALNPGKKFFSLDIAYTATDAALTALGISVEGENA